MKRKNSSSARALLVIIYGIISMAFMIFNITRPFSYILIGLGFVYPSVKLLYNNIDFDLSKKIIVNGELIEIEKEEDSEGILFYKLYYKYVFNDLEKIYVKNISPYSFSRKKIIGDKDKLLILVKDPDKIRIKKIGFRLIEYFISLILLGTGVIVLIIGLFKFF